MTSIDIEDDFALCDHEQAEEAAAPPSPCGENAILIDAITGLEDDEVESTSLHEDYDMLTDAVATLEDNQKRQPSTSIDNGFPTDAHATLNDEPYISKTAAEIEALAETGAEIFFASLSESKHRAIEDEHGTIVSALDRHDKTLYDSSWNRKFMALVASDIAERKAKRLASAEETRQMLKEARKLREDRLARNGEMKETLLDVLMKVSAWVLVGLITACVIKMLPGMDREGDPRGAGDSW